MTSSVWGKYLRLVAGVLPLVVGERSHLRGTAGQTWSGGGGGGGGHPLHLGNMASNSENCLSTTRGVYCVAEEDQGRVQELSSYTKFHGRCVAF